MPLVIGRSVTTNMTKNKRILRVQSILLVQGVDVAAEVLIEAAVAVTEVAGVDLHHSEAAEAVIEVVEVDHQEEAVGTRPKK